MKYLEVRLSLPERLLHPMQSFIRHEDVVRYEELLTWSVQPEAGREYLLFYAEADVDRYRAAIDGVDSVAEYRLAPIDDESVHAWVCQETRSEDRAWRSAFAGRQLLVVPPIRFDENADVGMTIVGEGGAAQETIAAIPDDVAVAVEEVGTYDRRGGTIAGALTDRQLAALSAARAVGYYEVPGEATLADVADRLDCAESTASELLGRAERALVTRVLDRYGGAAGRADSPADDGR